MAAQESMPPEGTGESSTAPAAGSSTPTPPTGGSSQGTLSLIEKVQLVLTKPNEFFPRIAATEHGVQPAFMYYAIISIISALLSGWQTQNLYANYSIPGQTSFLGTVIGTYIFSLVAIFVIAAILHQFVKLFKGQGGYDRTFQTLAYAGTAGVLGSIPLIGFLFVLYSIYLAILGLKHLHTMPMAQAAWAYIATILVIFAVAFALTLLFIGSVATLFGFFL